MAAKIKKGDTVVILTGKDKGKSGEVLHVSPKESRVVVQGVNLVKRHTRPSALSQGGILTKEAALHLSNVALADPKSGKATRVGFSVAKDGSKVRVAKKSGETVSA